MRPAAEFGDRGDFALVERYFAHTKPGAPETEWEPLESHLRHVAEIAARFAEPMGAADWARIAGLWHDLGKYSNAFQKYLKETTSPDPHVADGATRTDHSTAGAQHAAAQSEVLGHVLAYVIAGHHSGLLDGRSAGACLELRLEKPVEPWNAAPASILDQRIPDPPPFLRSALGDRTRRAFSLAFFTRMVFSSLVDADFLATEAFMNPGQAASRPVWPVDTLERLERSLDAWVSGLSSRPSKVDRARAIVRDACIAASGMAPGLFSLTVPTGGGKTLSSVAFALHHALRHGLRRVVYVAPFTTIIEQNAEVIRRALRAAMHGGMPNPVLEHHSNLDVGQESVESRLATENWDAPIVVTTAVQFYESIFGNRTSRCRKLHNLSKSVILLDEAQVIPVDHLAPCLRALEELTRHYGATVVLCTATQPALSLRTEFPIGLADVREIVPRPAALYESLRRVRVSDLGSVDDLALSQRLLREDRVLCVVNTRSHARRVFELLGDTTDHFHLSAWMCPRHRSDVLRRIRQRLAERQPCRVVSTQLIEAGVDIDFPVVFRSMAGVDSIAQSAGRCNRNGTLDGLGQTYVFQSEHVRSERFFAETADCARQVLPLHDDPLSLDAIEHYFRQYYWEQQTRWDAKGILNEFHVDKPPLPLLMNFAKVAESFRLIEDTGMPVIVPWDDEGRALSDKLRRVERLTGRELLRRLQPYSVQVPSRVWNAEVGRSLELVHGRYAIVLSLEMNYCERLGLRFDAQGDGAFFG